MKLKKYIKFSTLMASLLLLSGCVGRSADGQPTGIIWELFGHPAERAIIWFAQLFGGGVGTYALGIIIVTFIVRLAIAPLNIGMTKATIESSEKMSYIKPMLDDITARIKQATSPQEQMAIRQEQIALQQAAGVKVISAAGCLPIFIQIPLFSALYFATITSPAINNDVFLSIPLGKPSVVFAIVSAVLYYIQGLISQVGMSEEQKRINRSVLIITPIMQIVFGLQVPAGASLYFVVGGIVICLTTLYTSYKLRPQLKEKIAQEMKDNTSLKQFMQQQKQRKDVTPQSQIKQPKTINTIKKRRNEGKQHK